MAKPKCCFVNRKFMIPILRLEDVKEKYKGTKSTPYQKWTFRGAHTNGKLNGICVLDAKENIVHFYLGWLDFMACQPLDYFMQKTFILFILVKYLKFSFQTHLTHR